MRIFISYARVDRAYCVEVARILDIHDLWFDQRLYAGQDWWKEILRRLEWCETFIYLLSPESIESSYCRREYQIARKLGKRILPVLISNDARIPEEIARLHYIDLSEDMGTEVVKSLLNALYIIENDIRNAATNVPQPRLETSITKADEEPPVSSVTAIVGKVAAAMDAGKFDQAVFLLKQAKEKGFTSRFVNLDALLVEAEVALDRQTQRKEVELEYRTIAELVKRPVTRKLGCQAFRGFQKDYPEYDPDGLAHLCMGQANGNNSRGTNQSPPSVPRVGIVDPSLNADYADKVSSKLPALISIDKDEPLPLLEWCEVNTGRLILGETANIDAERPPHTVRVDRFFISKYPITNAQFQYFVDDPQGYANDIWWKYSEYAIDWHRKNPKAREPRFEGNDRPRENICWYEAIAFCNWLGNRLNKMITLPTRYQWRRAAQGDTTYQYPWGDEFTKNHCNTRESRIRMTTLVMRYMNGVSPFGVYDMAGNVWEWCLDVAQDYSHADPLRSNAPRTVMGGSFKTSHHRAQSTFHFHLDPDYYYGTIGFRVVWLV